MADFLLQSLRGGQSEDAPTAIGDDQCAVARNIEYWESQLGERRLGGAGIDLSGSPVEGCDRIVWLYRHLPTSDPSDAQLWVLGITDPSTAVLCYKDTSWHTVTMPDALVIDGVSEYQVQGATLHGKLFIAYKSAVDRLHVFVAAASALRRTGVAEPAAPTAAENAIAGSFSGDRYYRVRFIEKSGSVVLRRSEPSDVQTISPTATKSGVVVTKPASVSEGETHWELEASTDNANFYVLATTAVGTTTVTDSTDFSVGYARDFVLSEDIGDYELFPSVRLLTTDQDRLIGGGSFEDAALASRVMWSPVNGDPGDGNDERIPRDTVNYLDLDNYEGGPLTALSATVNGYVFAMKLSHTYQLSRTGVRTRAYQDRPLTKQRGALYGSLIEALDHAGNPSPYFLDPDIGPCRVGPGGVEPCGGDLLKTWETVNLDATKVAVRSLFYPEKMQALWCIAAGDSDTPTLGLTLHTNLTRDEDDGLHYGWAVWDGPRTQALSMCLFADNIDDDAARSNALVPFIGVEGDGLVWRCDTGDDDNGTAYSARILSKAFVRRNLLNQFECKSGVLLAKAAEGVSVVVTVVGNFGNGDYVREAEPLDLSPENGETYVVRTIDDLGLAGLFAVQVQIEDTETPAGQWSIELLALRDENGQRAS